MDLADEPLEAVAVDVLPEREPVARGVVGHGLPEELVAPVVPDRLRELPLVRYAVVWGVTLITVTAVGTTPVPVGRRRR